MDSPASMIHVADDSAILTVAGACRLTDEHHADCALSFFLLQYVGVDLADGDDSATVIGVPSEMRGGRGDDVLNGGAAPDELDGGSGRDSLNGGGDADTVSYASRVRPLDVDLSRVHGQGERGEGDSITEVERVVGGWGNDVLAGDNGQNFLDGGPGQDELRGRGGSDTLEGGHGEDVLYGGPGDDDIAATPNENDEPDGVVPYDGRNTVVCGTGNDSVTTAEGNLVEPDCELVELGQGFLTVTPNVLASGRSPALFFKSDDPCGICSVEIRAAEVRRGPVPGTLLGSRRTPSSVTTRSFPLVLSIRGRSLLERYRHLVVRIIYRNPSNPASLGYLTTLSL
jgi:hypothetical protein